MEWKIREVGDLGGGVGGRGLGFRLRGGMLLGFVGE